MPYTFAGHYAEALIDLEGDALVITSVRVYIAGTGTLATLYTNRLKTTVAANPATTSDKGNLEIFADPGDYELAAIVAGVEQDRQPAPIAVDPGEVDAKVGAHSAQTTGSHGGIVALDDVRLTDARTPSDGSVTDAKVAAGAAIAKAKLAALEIVDADVAAGAAIAKAKLAALGIVDADVDAAAAIALSKLATDPLARANHTGTQLAATVSDFDAQVHTARLDQLAAPSGAVSMAGQRLTNLPAPGADSDPATKSYADSIAAGFHVLTAAACKSTGNLTLSGEQTIDGILTSASRVLVANQTAPAENGVYVTAAGAWARATDADSSAELVAAAIFVSAGTVNGLTTWVQQTPATITVGTTAIQWAQFAASGTVLGGAGIVKTGNTLDVVAADATLTVNADSIQVASGGIGATQLAASAVTNAKVSASAAIARSKLDFGSGLVNSDLAAAAAIAYSKLSLAGSLVNADVATGAAIAYAKLNLLASIVNADVATGAAIAYSKLNLAASIVNADVAAGAAIARSKLDFGAGLVNADLSAAAAIAYSKLALTGSVVNADIAAGAAIALTKLASAVVEATGGGKETIQDHGAMGATETFDLTLGNYHKGQLNANCVFTFAGATSGKACSFTLKLTQDATGSRTVTWPASVDWPLAVAPTLSTGANKVDVFSFLSDDGGTTWLGFVGGLDFR